MAQRSLSRTRRAVPIVVLVVSVLAACGYSLDRRSRPFLLTGPMVQIPEPGTLVVTWSSGGLFDGGKIELRGPDGTSISQFAELREGRYEARFEGLTPGETYHYDISNARFFSYMVPLCGPYRVKLPPGRGEPIRFIAFGDSGNGSNTQANVADAIVAQNPDVVIHVGDLVYPAGATRDYPFAFYEPNAGLIRSVPFMPCLGNHDVASERGRPLLAEFVLPENGPPCLEAERNYYFDCGEARFVALDTNRDFEGGVLSEEEMKTIVAPWLREVLLDCDARWKFVYFHHPFYTGSDHFAEGQAYVKDAFVDVLEEGGVDLVFAGHNHLYERTWPLREDRIVPDGEGVVYITTGAGGVNVYPEMVPPPAYMRAFNDSEFSFTRVDVKGDLLELKQINEAGRVIDEYTIRKAAGGEAAGTGEVAVQADASR